MSDIEKLASELTWRMKAARTNPAKLSEDAGLNRSYIRDLMKARSKRPDIFSIERIAQVLGCSIYDLIGHRSVVDTNNRASVDVSISSDESVNPLDTQERLLILELWDTLSPRQRDHFLGLLEAVAIKKVG